MNKLKLPIVPEQRDETEVKRITCVFFLPVLKTKKMILFLSKLEPGLHRLKQ